MTTSGKSAVLGVAEGSGLKYFYHVDTRFQVQVVIRVRPPLPRELQGYRPFENSALVDPNQRVITLSENLQSLTANGSAQSPDNGMVRSVDGTIACYLC